jgi:class 3 adenylate cyclase/tetratricopeptide (TPR) repeat protein
MPACQTCGAENAEGARFCQACGSPLPVEDAADRQRKTVTIVFSDVAGSTALGERLDPEMLRRVMATYFDRMRAVLERHGGTVEKYIGDAIVAVFGIPELREDDALRAVRAAEEMRAALEDVNRELGERWGVAIEARTGINTGEVLAEEARPDIPLTADAANLAARLEQAAEPGEILLGETTYGLVRDAVEAESAGPLEVKGKSAPQAAWRLLRVRPDARGIARRLDSPIVGRDQELTLLQEVFDSAVRERACRLVTVVAPPGVGKSRLAAEVLQRLEGRATVLVGRCLPYGDGITYWPVAEALREAAAITEADPPAAATAKIAELLGDDSEAAVRAERLGSALGLTEATAPPQEIFWAFRRLVETMAEHRPVVIEFDDIHWGEPTFLDLVEYLAGWSTGAPIFILCLARPDLLDNRPGWATGVDGATVVGLEPLDDDDSERLIENLLGPAPLPDAARSRIRQVAEGNPLFVEEILRMLVDQGLLRRTDGRWEAAGDLSAIAVPPTINALLAARLERLSREERAVIQRASVVGKVFWWDAVAELSPAPARSAVGSHLQSLVRRELVRPEPSRVGSDDAFRFSHILIRDAAYAGVTKELRAELHERFAEWLERRPTAGLEPEELVGYHLAEAHRYRTELRLVDDHTGDLAGRAATLLGSAGQRALARWDIPAAVSLLTRATDLQEPRDPARLWLLVALGEALHEAGEVERATAVFDEALAGAEEVGDERLGARVRVARWMSLVAEGDVEAALNEGRRAMEVFERHGDRRGVGRAWNLVGRGLWHSGRAAEANEAFEEALRHARAAGDTWAEADIMTMLGAGLAQGPRPAEEAARRAEAILEEKRGDRTIEAYMHHALAHLRAWQGRFEEARESAGRYSGILRENGMLSSWAESLEAAADVERTAGNTGEAIGLLLQGQAAFDSMGIPDRTLLPFLAAALYLEDRLDEAEAAAVRAREDPHPLWGTVATGVLARIRARRGRGAEAESLAQEALGRFEATDFPVFLGRALVDFAEVLRILGREEEAVPLLRQAVEVFERKGAAALAQEPRTLLRSIGAGSTT